MAERKRDIRNYFNSLEQKLAKREVVSRSIEDIVNFPSTFGQCMYVMNFKTKSLTFQKGVKEMLGYDEHEFTFDLVTNYFHPDDEDILTRLIKATLVFASEHDVSREVAFFLTYRVRHKNGKYIKVMRQSTTFDLDEEGKIISNLSILSDISFLNTSDKVEWKFDAPGLDSEKFKKYVTKEYKGFFSDRESEIIQGLAKGRSSKELAKQFNLSKHTVDTHRRRILHKSRCKNTVELINFCKHNGLM
ncbi:MAG: PAS domain-containing protein [Sphingobacteriaceae bacterium]|nr:PAS domain-containing protein [Sphingobacteriaceae bacterium]